MIPLMICPYADHCKDSGFKNTHCEPHLYQNACEGENCECSQAKKYQETSNVECIEVEKSQPRIWCKYPNEMCTWLGVDASCTIGIYSCWRDGL